MAEIIRESVIAGSWYPGNPERLRKEVSKYLDQADSKPPEGDLAGLIVPHAGYMYSGGVAAHAYHLLQYRSFNRVMILAPSHRMQFKGASVYPLGGYRTPLGVVPLDNETVQALLAGGPLVRYLPHADDEEHSLEIQLPFLQVTLKDFSLTPVVMGDQSASTCRALADRIAEVCRESRILLIASSDLSHYHAYEEARRLDQRILDHIQAFDPDGLLRDIEAGRCEACGAAPMATLMLTVKQLGANRATVLHYANSGDVTGDLRGVVGYMAAAFHKSEAMARDKTGGKQRREKVGVDLGLSADEKKVLKDLALRSIQNRCLGETPPEPPANLTEKLKEPRGAFVCLHKGKELRGCIGLIEARLPLHETIREMAVQAAFGDPRFCALDPSELGEIDLEISVLTPFRRIKDPSEIELGRDGLLIRKGVHSGLLLPQVAVENGWDRTKFLEWTCRKAGLGANEWKSEDAEIQAFSADVF